MLTRGPVHEAFAETVTFDPEPGIVVPKAPPAAIEEVPPEQRPEGANVAWIPGYWGWDDERNDFLWVSGIWRALPPGRQWVPGYWGKSGARLSMDFRVLGRCQGERGGILARAACDRRSRSQHCRAFGRTNTWLPGCWVWQQSRYAWRPGFWATVQPDWDWVPAHYVWAPRGYVFVDGYWDYSIGRRGVLFAPVYFDAGVYARRGFSYSPTTVIDLGVFANHLFLRPQYQHYYFGDYYAANYRGAGFYPSYSYQLRPFRLRSDLRSRPLAASAGPRVGAPRQQADFQNRRDHEDAAAAAHVGGPESNGRACGAGQERGAPWSPRRLTTSEGAKTVRCDSSRWTSQRDKQLSSAWARGPAIPRGAAKAGNQRGGCSSRNAHQGIRAGQSETSRVSDCGEARR